MTKQQFKSIFIPDTPKEWAFIGSSVGRLGTAMTGFGAFAENLPWTLTALFFTWIGFEVNGYFKLYDDKKED